jgi:asparagine synthetase B (glutamine-hydrolysing)
MASTSTDPSVSRCAASRSSISRRAATIHNADRSSWIVFNGEIYNYLELREKLEKLGHTFYTNSDTEAIVHAYDQFGSDCPKHLRGMFAFAIWNERTRNSSSRDPPR